MHQLRQTVSFIEGKSEQNIKPIILNLYSIFNIKKNEKKENIENKPFWSILNQNQSKIEFKIFKNF